MPPRTRHPRLARVACAVYSLTLWLYPAEFRRTFGRELVVTFRTRVEDVLDGGGLRERIAFAAHIGWDTIQAVVSMLAADDACSSASLLGLSDGGVATGGLPRARFDIHWLFTAAGLLLALGGWYAYFAVLPLYVS